MKRGELRRRVHSTALQIRAAEQRCVDMPKSFAAQIELAGLRAIFREQEFEYQEAFASFGGELLMCRIFEADGRETLKSVAAALERMQDLLTVVYSGVRTGKAKKSARVARIDEEATELVVEHAYVGSIGLALTAPLGEPLLVEGPLERSIRFLMSLPESNSRSIVEGHARRLGAASIRALHEWARVNADANLGVHLDYRRSGVRISEVTIGPDQFRKVLGVIEEASEPVREELEFDGVLVGADSATRSFHFRTATGDLRGHLGERFDAGIELVIDREYRAQVLKVESPKFWKGAPDVTWSLLGLVALRGS